MSAPTHYHACNSASCASWGVPESRVLPEGGREAFGTLVVHELNVLSIEQERNRVDEDPRPFTCCARCCAPCGVLLDLLDAGRLTEVISWAPRELAADWRLLNEQWLRDRWGCNNNPPCDTEES
jgi:hypothetical protein